jgi:hypothetical protein
VQADCLEQWGVCGFAWGHDAWMASLKGSRMHRFVSVWV